MIQCDGAEEYERRFEEYISEHAIETVNGFPIWRTGARFDVLYHVGRTGRTAATLEGARRIARALGAEGQEVHP